VKYDPKKHHRPFSFAHLGLPCPVRAKIRQPKCRQGKRSIGMRGYDYTQPGAYFVTIVVQDRVCLFDDPVLGSVVERYWQAISEHATHATLDAWVVMPNHLYGIIVITDRPAMAETVGARHSQEVSSSMLEVPSDEMPTSAAGTARNALPLLLENV